MPLVPSALLFGRANRSFIPILGTALEPISATSEDSDSREYVSLPEREESHSRAMCMVSASKPACLTPARSTMCRSNEKLCQTLGWSGDEKKGAKRERISAASSCDVCGERG